MPPGAALSWMQLLSAQLPGQGAAEAGWVRFLAPPAANPQHKQVPAWRGLALAVLKLSSLKVAGVREGCGLAPWLQHCSSFLCGLLGAAPVPQT